MGTFWHLAVSASASGSSSNLRLAPVLRWLGLTLVVLLALQISVVLSGADWSEPAFQQLLIERLVSQAPMGFVGLLLMLIGSRLDHPGAERTVIRWVVCVLSALLTVVMIAVVPMAISGNQTLSGQADQTLQQRRGQLEMARQQGKNPDNVKMLGDQLAQAGQLPAGASDEEKTKAAQLFIDGQLQQMDDQIQQAERQRNLAVNQRRYGGTVSAVVLAIAFVLLAFAAVL
ncbi:hypothetical protein H0O21_03520 [Synechococcus sp. HK01-R]|nr:hypothetical protein H0O21_03520 [Synechococcus sp. HK01-R]